MFYRTSLGWVYNHRQDDFIKHGCFKTIINEKHEEIIIRAAFFYQNSFLAVCYISSNISSYFLITSIAKVIFIIFGWKTLKVFF